MAMDKDILYLQYWQDEEQNMPYVNYNGIVANAWIKEDKFASKVNTMKENKKGVCKVGERTFYANSNVVQSPFEIQKFVNEIRSGDYNAFFRRLQSFFADTPYELIRDLELHYQNVLFIVFKLVGFYVHVEYHTGQGRIDLVLQTDKFIYVMEFKLDGTAEAALQQINERQYTRPFESDPRELLRIGVNFSSETRNIEKWIVE